MKTAFCHLFFAIAKCCLDFGRQHEF